MPSRDPNLLRINEDRGIAQLDRAVSKVLEQHEDEGPLCAICHQPESKHALVGIWCASENEDQILTDTEIGETRATMTARRADAQTPARR